MKRTKIAILDDYQKAALTFGDWSLIRDHADITVFSDHIDDEAKLSEILTPFAIICIMRERTPITASLLSALPNLKLIVSTGPRNAAIDLEAAKARGIAIAHTAYVNSGAPELTWALLMAVARHIPTENQALKSGAWQTRVGTDLSGKTIGIIGLGNIGIKIATIAKAFNMNVIAWSDNLTTDEAAAHGVQYVSKDDLFREADFITVHLVLSARSKGIIQAQDLELMKPSAFIINTSRGPLIDEAALIAALRANKIAGAALDVFNEEPLPLNHPFRQMENVLATPHIGYVTEDTYRVFFNDTRRAIENWLLQQTHS